MDRDDLFLDTLADLEARDAATADYDVLGAAVLLRRLLLDDSPLLHQVNRQRRLSVRFLINGIGVWPFAPGVLPEPEFVSMEDGLDPATSVPSPAHTRPTELTLDQFLATEIIIYSGHSVTVRDLISHAANVQGAVHAGTPRTDKDRALSEMGERIRIGGFSSGIRPLRAITRVVLRALDPLRVLVTTERDEGGT